MNRKKLFCFIVLSSVLAFSAFHLNIHSNKIAITDSLLENVEALAQESNIPDCSPLKGYCYEIELSTTWALLK